MATLKKLRGKYLLVMIAMCGLVASTLGIMTNVAGIFFTPMAEELGKETAAVNLTLTSLLRAINNHREELRRQGKEEPVRREPAEVLVERVIQHRQDREVRRQERRRFDYDLPVDDPDARPAETDAQKRRKQESKPVSNKIIQRETGMTQRRSICFRILQDLFKQGQILQERRILQIS